jgi:hypothetical protein
MNLHLTIGRPQGFKLIGPFYAALSLAREESMHFQEHISPNEADIEENISRSNIDCKFVGSGSLTSNCSDVVICWRLSFDACSFPVRASQIFPLAT